MNSSVSPSVICSAIAPKPAYGTQSFIKEQLDTLKGILQEFTLPLPVVLYRPDDTDYSITAIIQPDYSVTAEIVTDGTSHIETYPNCLTFVKEVYCLWEQDPEYRLRQYMSQSLVLESVALQQYFHCLTAEDILRSITIANGEFANMTLWYIYRRFPGFMTDAGFTQEQITCRRLLGNLMPGVQFLIRARRITLNSNHLFSYRETHCLTCAMAVKETTGRVVTENEALTMMYLLDGREEEELDETIIGYGLSLNEILKTFSLFKLRYLGKVMAKYDYGIMMEIQQYLALINDESTKKGKIPFVIRCMNLLYKDGIDFVKKHPDFNKALVSKCQEFIQDCANEHPECCSSCQRLLDKLLPDSNN